VERIEYESLGLLRPEVAGPLQDGKMKKKRFTEEQIIGILRKQETGAKVADLARNMRFLMRRSTIKNLGLADGPRRRSSGCQ
jgi:hypothetical protein